MGVFSVTRHGLRLRILLKILLSLPFQKLWAKIELMVVVVVEVHYHLKG